MNFTIDKKKLLEGEQRICQNYKIVEYYQTLYQITDQEKYVDKCHRISQCYKYFDVDLFKLQNIIDIKHISLCHDKFCKNCQNLLSKQRYIHFKPFLDELAEDNDIYHVTLTVPSISGLLLQSTLDKMYTSFAKFIKIFRRKNSRHLYLGLDELGYSGAIRSLEITYKDGMYHPHFHCLFVLHKELNLDKVVINKYSFDEGVLTRKFSEFEITIQKLWYMIFNDIRITESSFTNLALGYSCTADITNFDYKEVFKYTLKESFDFIMQDELVFMVLYRALENRRIIQGYGSLFALNYADDEISQEADIRYIKYVGQLWQVEEPKTLVLRLQELISDIDSDVTYISRKTLKGVLQDEE